MITLVSDTSFTQLVNEALRNYQSTLALSRSDLANSALVTPTLVKDESSPTAEERGYGLRLVLQWAVKSLAPGATSYPLGEYRPLDDPTWHDPRWWGYNILRHRYLEPLHPDDFVEGGRFTESLLALTGISSSDAFFDERQRAIRAVAERLRQQLIDGQASGELQRLALQEAVQPLAKEGEAMRLLGIAATFDDIFPQRLLLEISAHEKLHAPAALLSSLIGQRFLLTGDEGQKLWLSPVLRRYVYELQRKEESRQRHRWIASYYTEVGEPLCAARHWLRAEEESRALRVLMPAVPELLHELQVKELIEFLQQVEPRRLEGDQYYRVQLLLSDLFQRIGQFEDTLTACRHALQATDDPTEQARVYRRMGKLYESRNQAHALRYYQQAVERFADDEPELAELLKDRGWLRFYRQEWEEAEADLQRALDCVPPEAHRLQADILDAMASVSREQKQRQRALAYAERALAIRERVGDLLAIAKSLGNLGFLYRAMQEYQHAILAHQEALATYEKLGNRELMAAAWLNIGASHYHSGDLASAIHAYRQSLEIGQAMGLPLIELKAHYNLAEAYGATGHLDHAASHWRVGYQLCEQHGFADQSADFVELARELKLPADLVSSQGQIMASGLVTQIIVPAANFEAGGILSADLNAEEAALLEVVKREQQITPRRLMLAADISRATATRRLSALVDRGLLVAHGKGRGAYYTLPTAPERMAAQAMQGPEREADTEAEQRAEEIQAILQSVLLREESTLRAKYDLLAIGLLAPGTSPPTPEGASVPPMMVVRFAQIPDLAAFFALRRHLTSLLQLEIDLLPDFTLSSTELQNDIEWIWH